MRPPAQRVNSFQGVACGIFLLLWTVAWSFLLLELGIRAYFSIRVDPDVLLWGSQWHREQMQQQFMRGQNVFEHENAQTGFAKYLPRQKTLPR